MSTGVNAAVRAPAGTARQHRLRRGRTRILALSDLTMLALAYTVSYLIADRIAPLPPVSGSAWFLALVAVTAPFVWLTSSRPTTSTTTTASGSRSRASTSRAISSTRCSSARSATCSCRRASTTSSTGGSTRAVEAVHLPRRRAACSIPVVRGSIRSWVFPRVMQPRRTLIVGSGDEARLVYRKIMAHPEYGLEIVGFLDGEDDERLPEPVLGLADRGRRRSSTSTRSTACCSPRRSAATRRRSISCARCAGPTCRSRSCRATSRSSPRTRRSTTSRACRS